VRSLAAPNLIIIVAVVAGVLLSGRPAQASPGTTTRVSVDSAGNEGNSYSWDGPAISADGRFVAFGSVASNLVLEDTNTCVNYPEPGSCPDIFVHDRQTGVTTRASVDSSGNQGSRDSWSPAISADGRYVAFTSFAPNLVPGDTNTCGGFVEPGTCPDVFVHDRQTGTTTRASVDSSGNQGNGASGVLPPGGPTVNADGRYVAFTSWASNLAPGDTNGVGDIFVHDQQTGQTTRVSVDSLGNQGNGDSGGAAISADARYVAFASSASNLAPGDTNGVGDIFVHDRQTGQTTRVSLDSLGNQGNGVSLRSAITTDGRYVAFASSASNLAPGDTNGVVDVFVHDRHTGETSRASVDSAGQQGGGPNFTGAISADGRHVAFKSEADNLVPGDTGNYGDIFVRDRGAPAPVGGIAELPALPETSAPGTGAPAEAGSWSAGSSAALAGVGTAAATIAVAGAWYARRRRPWNS
jgi:Tol biopolymer transport system component